MMNLETLISIQQLVWCTVFIIGLEFFLLSFFIKEDKSFLLLGASILSLSLMSGMDIWFIFPDNLNRDSNKLLQLFSIYGIQIMASIYLIIAIWLTRLLSNRPFKKTAIFQSSVMTIFGVSFLFDAIFSKNIFFIWNDNKPESTLLYKILFAPICVLIFGHIVFYTVKPVRLENLKFKKSKIILGVAYIILLISGLMDLITMVLPKDPFPNFSSTEIGILSLVLSGTFIFTAKILELYNTHQSALLEIEKINESLHSNQPLALIGESTKKITEEIIFQASSLNQYSNTYLKSTTQRKPIELERIEQARKNLEIYSNKILEFSTCTKLNFSSKSSYSDLLANAVAHFAPDFQKKISVVDFNDVEMTFDKNKLHVALIELIRNAFDSNANRIIMRSKIQANQLILEIEDDGNGIENESIQKITSPFFTTQKSAGKMGLGANIAKAIIESHGGSISFFNNGSELEKKLTKKNGMTVQVSLPLQLAFADIKIHE